MNNRMKLHYSFESHKIINSQNEHFSLQQKIGILISSLKWNFLFPTGREDALQENNESCFCSCCCHLTVIRMNIKLQMWYKYQMGNSDVTIIQIIFHYFQLTNFLQPMLEIALCNLQYTLIETVSALSFLLTSLTFRGSILATTILLHQCFSYEFLIVYSVRLMSSTVPILGGHRTDKRGKLSFLYLFTVTNI